MCGMLHESPQAEQAMSAKMMQQMRSDVIGKGILTQTPYGRRIVTYCDYTASGRMIGLVEDFLRQHVYPWYSNVHTDTNACGSQTNRFFSDARELIAEGVGAPLSEYSVIFTGSGMTGAVSKLGYLLGLKAEQFGSMAALPRWMKSRKRGVVFVGPYEHHSNEVFWREMNCDVVVIPEDAHGRIDTLYLRRQLAKHMDRHLRLGCFTAGSNVTGIQTDVHELAQILHSYGALAAFDYAAAGPYCEIDCEGSGKRSKQWPGEPSLDAIMLSPHKLPGGPGSCGILVVRRSIVKALVPQIPGGGTVQFVAAKGHLYHTRVEDREEGGTPNVIGAIRAAIAFHIKATIGPHVIHELDEQLAWRAISAWKSCPGIVLVGGDRSAYHESPRLSILSFNLLAKMPNGKGEYLLHPHFVAAVLNDVYGIQARSGCSCAGPYGQVLLQDQLCTIMGFKNPDRLWQGLQQITTGPDGMSMYKPGWVRVNLSYILEPYEVDYIINAVMDASRNAWKLLPQYEVDFKTGMFTHRASGDAQTTQRLKSTFDEMVADIASPLPLPPTAGNSASLQHENSLLVPPPVPASTAFDGPSQGSLHQVWHSVMAKAVPAPTASPPQSQELAKPLRASHRSDSAHSLAHKRTDLALATPSLSVLSEASSSTSAFLDVMPPSIGSSAPRNAKSVSRPMSQTSSDMSPRSCPLDGSDLSAVEPVPLSHCRPGAGRSPPPTQPRCSIAGTLKLQMDLAREVYANAAAAVAELRRAQLPIVAAARREAELKLERSRFRWFLLPSEAQAALEQGRSLAIAPLEVEVSRGEAAGTALELDVPPVPAVQLQALQAALRPPSSAALGAEDPVIDPALTAMLPPFGLEKILESQPPSVEMKAPEGAPLQMGALPQGEGLRSSGLMKSNELEVFTNYDASEFDIELPLPPGALKAPEAGREMDAGPSKGAAPGRAALELLRSANQAAAGSALSGDQLPRAAAAVA